MQKNKTLIIAEAGVNHNGDIKIAKKLIDIAVSAGADIIKFQTFKADNLLIKKAPKAKYQIKATNKKETNYEMIKKLELSHKDHKKLFNYCNKKKIEYLSSPFDIDSIRFLTELNLKRIKIPSGEINNFQYLEAISRFKGKIIISTGMSTIKEITNTINYLYRKGIKQNQITLLHCNSAYPTPLEDINLNVISEMKKKFKIDIGYSDHSVGIEVPIAAAALGAKVIEKHFTISNVYDGPDHKVSLSPKELKTMIKSIRNIDIAMGSFLKKITKSEMENLKISRKSIVANIEIKKGEIFTEMNLALKRPAEGISPIQYRKLIGKKSKKNYKVDVFISKNELKK